MVLTALLMTLGQASAFEYVGAPLARFGRGHSISGLQMAVDGSVCFATYAADGSRAYLWQPSDSTPTEIYSSGAGSYVGCSAISEAGYTLLYESSSTGYSSVLYDSYTDDLIDLEYSGDGYAYGFVLNDNGYVGGYVLHNDGTGYGPAWWGPEGGEANVVAFSGYDYAYATAIDESNRLLISGYTYTRFGAVTDVSLYDVDREATYGFGADLPRGGYPVLTEDGDVLVYGSGGGPTLKYDFDADDLDIITADPFAYTYAYASNAAGQVVLTTYTRDGSYTAACWDEAHGAVELDGGEMGYVYAAGINDAGQVVGYGYDSAGNIQGYLWECSTGEATLLPTPGETVMSYPTAITEDGLVILYAVRDLRTYTYSVWVMDPVSGQVDRLTGDDAQTAYVYGYSQETGDILLYEQSRGRGVLTAYHRVN